MKYLVILFIVDMMYLGVRFMWWYEFRRVKGEYFQTWVYIANLDKFHKKIFRILCGLILRHPLSSTEWGYGGGEYADRWCRWCNKQFKVPKESVYFTHPEAKELMKEVGEETTDEDN